jgi:hypothetical protein
MFDGLDRLAFWLAQLGRMCAAWFVHQPWWIQFALIVFFLIVLAAGLNRDEVRRELEWREFKAWRKANRHELKGLKR